MEFCELEGKRLLVTGANGLIGKAILARILSENRTTEVYALVRDEGKARRSLSHLPQERLHYLVGDMCDLKAEGLGIHYIIHGASKTASKAFIDEPVEVIHTSVLGTEKLLEFARVNPVGGFVYLSSMEVYGTPSTDAKVTEQSATNLDPMSVRSSYPESKRLCECLCAAYASEYAVPARVIRLTQTFGEGVDYYDGRVFAEFARCVIEGRDIILKTKGETKRCYLDVNDAVNAILTVLLYGKNGEAYNAANEDSYCSIYELAEMVAGAFGQGKVKVCIEDRGDAEKLGYAKTLKMNLSAAKLRGLGWSPKVALKTTFERMIRDMRQQFSKESSENP